MTQSASSVVTETRPTTGWRLADIREVVRGRELLLFLATRDLRIRYAQAAFGILWVVLRPLAGMLAFTLVFDRVVQVSTEGIPYPVFSYVSLAMWTYLSGALTSVANSLTGNVALVTKVALPRLVLPVAASVPGLVDLGVALLAGLPLLVLTGTNPGIAVFTTPFWMVLGLVAPLGLGLALAAINVRFRDVRHVVGFITQLGLFITPVAYPTSSIASTWRLLYAANPFVAPIEGIRYAVAGGPFPGLLLVPSVATSVLVLVIGLTVFGTTERRFADVI